MSGSEVTCLGCGGVYDPYLGFTMHANNCPDISSHQSTKALRAERDALREALATAQGIQSGPNGSGRMKVVIDGLEPGKECDLLFLLSTMLDQS